MKTNRLPDSVREYFVRKGYHCRDEQYPIFGGVVLYLRTDSGRQEAAYYLAKRSNLELVSSDELRRVLDFLKGSGLPLRYVMTTSHFSPGAVSLGAEAGITLRTL